MNKPNFSFEKRAWRKSYRLVIGVDEVGRGAFAGPVVAGAAAFKSIEYMVSGIGYKKNNKIPNTQYQILNIILEMGINDSKKLSPKKREELTKLIKKYFYWGIGEVGVNVIDRKGIVKATEMAMRKAIKKILGAKDMRILCAKKKNSPNILISQYPNIFLLVDAFHVKYIPDVGLKNQQAIIKGDEKSISIAAASIIAKVYRDSLMRKLSLRYKKYQWQKNKGYGTKSHQEAIEKFGICRLHREKYIASWLEQT